MLASFALKFLVPNHFLDGRHYWYFTFALQKCMGWNLGLVLILLNIPFVVLAFYKVNRNFGIRSCLTIVLIALMLTSCHFRNSRTTNF